MARIHSLEELAAQPSSDISAVFERRESNARSYCRALDAVLTTGRGSILVDTGGREYIDFLAGAGALNYGHNDPDLKKALVDYIAGDGIAHGLDLHTDAKRRFLESFERIVLTPRGMDHRVQFTGPTGTNAVEAALKLARKATGRKNVIAFTNGFHGVSMGALAATANRDYRIGPVVSLPDVQRMPYDGYLGPETDTADLLERMLDDPASGVDTPAAILLETVQGEGGLNVASPHWLRRVADLAHRHNAVLIVDDIQAGCGRTGSFFSFEKARIQPDMVVLSKSLSGMGLPMSVLLIKRHWDLWRPGEHNGTFRGNAHAFVTADAALQKFWSDDALATDVARRADLVTEHLTRMARRIPGARVKGRGMMQGLDLRSGRLASEVRSACVRAGLVIECAGAHDEVVKVMAPLTTPDEVLERGLQILAGAVEGTVHFARRQNGRPASLTPRPAEAPTGVAATSTDARSIHQPVDAV